MEKNPAKFKIDASELAVRKAFIQQTRDEVNLMKARAENPGNFSAGTRAMDVSTIEIVTFKAEPDINHCPRYQFLYLWVLKTFQPSMDTIPLASPSTPSPSVAAAAAASTNGMPHSSSSHGIGGIQHNSLKSAIGGSVPGRVGHTKYSRLPNSPSHSLTNSNSQVEFFSRNIRNVH